LGQSIGIDEKWALEWAWQIFLGVKVGVANFFVGQSIGIDETNGVKVGVENFFGQSIGIDENNNSIDRY